MDSGNKLFREVAEESLENVKSGFMNTIIIGGGTKEDAMGLYTIICSLAKTKKISYKVYDIGEATISYIDIKYVYRRGEQVTIYVDCNKAIIGMPNDIFRERDGTYYINLDDLINEDES